MKPGEILPAKGELELNTDKKRNPVSIEVANTGDRPIQVGSHYHFSETNRALKFDRRAAYGHRLDIPAGTAVRFEPGDEKVVTLVELAGAREVHGLNALADGKVDDTRREAAVRKAAQAGFQGA